MEFRQRRFAAPFIVALGLLSCSDRADAQSVRAGIVTTVTGVATVARVSLAQPAALQFKDEVYLQDRITTEHDALVRILLGGKAIVTIREWSAVTITEKPGVSTVNVSVGRVAVSVVKAKMRPGEVIEVTTPNAVAAVRGTVIVAEVEPALQGVRSTITVLTGVIDVTRFDGARSSGPATSLGTLQRVVIQGAGPVGTPTAISREAGQQLGSEFTVPPKRSPHATSASAQQAVIEQAVQSTAQTVTKIAPVQGISSRSDAGGDSGGSTAGVGSLSGVSPISTGSVSTISTGSVSTISTGSVSTISTDGAVSVGTGPVRLKKP